MPTKKSDSTELSTSILVSEYDYIANSASQANEDRARVASFYLVAVGSLVAALFSTQLFDTGKSSSTLGFLFCGLFLVLTLLGSLTVIQLARLRTAWYESMLALNQIKEYAIGRDKDIARAFRWRSRSMPPLYKVNSVSFQQTIEVALLSGLTFGASVYFLQVGLAYSCAPCNLAYTISCSILGFLVQLFIYKRHLNQQSGDGDHAA